MICKFCGTNGIGFDFCFGWTQNNVIVNRCWQCHIIDAFQIICTDESMTKRLFAVAWRLFRCTLCNKLIPFSCRYDDTVIGSMIKLMWSAAKTNWPDTNSLSSSSIVFRAQDIQVEGLLKKMVLLYTCSQVWFRRNAFNVEDGLCEIPNTRCSNSNKQWWAGDLWWYMFSICILESTLI